MKQTDSNSGREWKLIFRAMKMLQKLQPAILPAAILAGLITSITPFINLYLSAQIINILSQTKEIRTVVPSVIWILICNLICGLLNSFFAQMVDILKYVLGHNSQLDLANKGYQLDYCDMENPDIREMREKLNRSRRGVQGLAEQVKSMVQFTCSIVVSLSLVVQMFFIPCTADGSMTQLLNSPFASLALLAIIILSTIYTMKTNVKIQKTQFQATNNSRTHHNFNGYYTYDLSLEYNTGKDIRLYGQQSLIKKNNAYHLGKRFEFQKIIPKMNQKYGSICSAMQVLVNLITFLYVGLKSLYKAFGVGNIVLYTGAVTQFGDGFTGFMKTLSELKQDSLFWQWYFEFIDLPNQKQTGSRKIDWDKAMDYEIAFDNVSFRYPGSDEYSLKNLSINFKLGDKVAVVGRNGSGKTTFIKLLCRLYDPQEGAIYLNGTNIKEYDYYEYLSFFSVVFQDFYLFSFTLGENVAAASDYNEEKAMDCLLKSGMQDRMTRFSEGIKTQLYNEFSEEGVEISGGEAQKIAIARALYKEAPFIVLDEPTAALDPIAEADIYSRLNEMIDKKTAIYISHRLSSCHFCNQIAVFDQGRLVQHGTHKELLEQTDGLYHELWNAQAQYYVS